VKVGVDPRIAGDLRALRARLDRVRRRGRALACVHGGLRGVTAGLFLLAALGAIGAPAGVTALGCGLVVLAALWMALAADGHVPGLGRDRRRHLERWARALDLAFARQSGGRSDDLILSAEALAALPTSDAARASLSGGENAARTAFVAAVLGDARARAERIAPEAAVPWTMRAGSLTLPGLALVGCALVLWPIEPGPGGTRARARNESPARAPGSTLSPLLALEDALSRLEHELGRSPQEVSPKASEAARTEALAARLSVLHQAARADERTAASLAAVLARNELTGPAARALSSESSGAVNEALAHLASLEGDQRARASQALAEAAKALSSPRSDTQAAANPHHAAGAPEGSPDDSRPSPGGAAAAGGEEGDRAGEGAGPGDGQRSLDRLARDLEQASASCKDNPEACKAQLENLRRPLENLRRAAGQREELDGLAGDLRSLRQGSQGPSGQTPGQAAGQAEKGAQQGAGGPEGRKDPGQPGGASRTPSEMARGQTRGASGASGAEGGAGAPPSQSAAGTPEKRFESMAQGSSSHAEGSPRSPGGEGTQRAGAGEAGGAQPGPQPGGAPPGGAHAGGSQPGGAGAGQRPGGPPLGLATRGGQGESGYASGVDVASGAGPSKAEVVQVAATEGFANRPYERTFSEYGGAVEETLERAQVPPEKRHLVRRYFQLIRPRGRSPAIAPSRPPLSEGDLP
jgi:hypothetical protein